MGKFYFIGGIAPGCFRRKKGMSGQTGNGNFQGGGTMDELSFIEWMRSRAPLNEFVVVGPGDDAAVVRLPGLTDTDLLFCAMHKVDAIDVCPVESICNWNRTRTSYENH